LPILTVSEPEFWAKSLALTPRYSSPERCVTNRRETPISNGAPPPILATSDQQASPGAENAGFAPG
jgi:hypothetical protein